METWKSIKGYEDIYKVSNLGRVKRLKGYGSKNDKILKQRSGKRGYYYINLCKNGKPKSQKIHRLVADAFIPNPNNKPQVNHKDGNKLNNNGKNLEWVTNKENILHGKQYKGKVYCFNNKKIYFSSVEAATDLKISNGHLSEVINKKRDAYKGYRFIRIGRTAYVN
jgi:hypothetical protein